MTTGLQVSGFVASLTTLLFVGWEVAWTLFATSKSVPRPVRRVVPCARRETQSVRKLNISFAVTERYELVLVFTKIMPSSTNAVRSVTNPDFFQRL